jgi:hypothetical protein
MKYQVLNISTFAKIAYACHFYPDDAFFLAVLMEHHYMSGGGKFELEAKELMGLTGISADKARRSYKKLNQLGFVTKTIKKNSFGVPVNNYQLDIERIHLAFPEDE